MNITLTKIAWITFKCEAHVLCGTLSFVLNH